MGSELTLTSYAEKRARHAQHWAYADQLMTMFVRGDSFRAMEAATGVPKSVCQRIVRAAGAQYVKDRYSDPDVVIGRELHTLDALGRANLRAALDGDEKAARIVLEVVRMRIRLLGLEAPVKGELTVKNAMDAEIERLVQTMRADPTKDDTVGALR